MEDMKLLQTYVPSKLKFKSPIDTYGSVNHSNIETTIECLSFNGRSNNKNIRTANEKTINAISSKARYGNKCRKKKIPRSEVISSLSNRNVEKKITHNTSIVYESLSKKHK